MLHITGIGILDFFLTILFIFIVIFILVWAFKELGFTADSLVIPPYEGLTQ